MRLRVRTLQNNEASVDAQPTDTIADIKAKVSHAFSHLDKSQIILIHSGRVLNDAQTVEHFGIKDDDMIVAMAKKGAAPSRGDASATTASSEESTTTAAAAAPTAADSTDTAAASAQHVEETHDDTSVSLPVTPADATAAAAPQSVPADSTAASDSTTNANAYEAAAASAFCDVTELQRTVNEIMSMGFEKDKVETALRAAFNNPDRAVEYLMSGIPESYVAEAADIGLPAAAQVPAAAGLHVAGDMAASVANSGGGDGAGSMVESVPSATPVPLPGQHAGGAGSTRQQTSSTGGAEQRPSPLAALRDHVMFDRMRGAVLGNPELLPHMLRLISEQNPRLAETIVANQDEFLRMLSSEGGDTAGGGSGTEGAIPLEGGLASSPPQGTIQLQFTAEEMDAIERLKVLGFSTALAAQAYIACDKNEELAANYLFENIGEDEEEDDALMRGAEPPAS